MWDRFFEQRPIQKGLRRAGIHFAKAAYEVVGGVAAFVDEVVSVVTNDETADGRLELHGNVNSVKNTIAYTIKYFDVKHPDAGAQKAGADLSETHGLQTRLSAQFR